MGEKHIFLVRDIFSLSLSLHIRLDQGLADGYSCPTCRRPLFLSGSREHLRSSMGDESTSEQLSLSNSEGDERRESVLPLNAVLRSSMLSLYKTF